MKKFRIVYSTKATGTEETACICDTLDEATAIAHKMLGEWLYFGDEQTAIGRVDSAYVADENGNPL